MIVVICCLLIIPAALLEIAFEKISRCIRRNKRAKRVGARKKHCPDKGGLYGTI